ncbi:MAG: hypothetical protein M3O24_03290 [Thermoproteota archaeon]|nr:hypothetical protein [Thermoproteota archaeon]
MPTQTNMIVEAYLRTELGKAIFIHTRNRLSVAKFSVAVSTKMFEPTEVSVAFRISTISLLLKPDHFCVSFFCIGHYNIVCFEISLSIKFP